MTTTTATTAPTVWAYLRVSTDAQDTDNQRHGVLEYANSAGLASIQFVTDTASGKTPWRDRAIGDLLLTKAKPGDVILFAEISRIARSTLQVLEVLEYAMSAEVSIHIAKQRMILDGSMQSKITATVLGLAAEIEREFISMRTREALAKRKAEGLPLGRRPGPAETLRLDQHADEIKKLLAAGVSASAIGRLHGAAKSTVYHWLRRRT